MRARVSQLFQSAGLPKGFYDQPDDFTNFLLNNVALPELQSRVDLYTNITMQQPREVRQALQDMYGITPGEMIAYFIDPNRALPLIQQRVNASQAAGMAQITGYGTLTQNEAERVASYGVSEPQEQQGFSQLAQMGQIFNPLIGRTGDAIDRAAQLSAAFGQGAGDIATIEQKRRQLLAEYQGGGDFAASQKGLSGIGTAQ